MSTSDEQPAEAGPELRFEPEEAYSLEVIEKITMVPRRTILVYHRHGLIRSSTSRDEGEHLFDDETVRALRRMESLRRRCRVNLAGLKLIMNLMREVDELRAELRFRRQ
ncbi:MAG: MerR family transcriptional regulator [Verrucomicrobia bacterium]|nr:MerR family transcriptional regulator [Verrucomicrobiota bacterium]